MYVSSSFAIVHMGTKLAQNRRSPRFVTAHAVTATRWGNVRQLLRVEFDKDGIRLLFYPKISRNGYVTGGEMFTGMFCYLYPPSLTFPVMPS
eukprot:COSAG02_NODE_562_length_20293_cov_37.104288_1_plen_92_part_00